MKSSKALLLDRDGVINVEKNYVHRIEEFEFLPGVFDVLKRFQEQGYRLVVITNQAGIARGYYSESDFHVLNEWMLSQFAKQGIRIDRVYFSPYHPVHGIGKYKRDSNCRKPNPGMILQAEQELDLDLAASILVGDKESDVEAGIRAGVGTTVLVKSGHPIDASSTKADVVIESIRDLTVRLQSVRGE